MWDRLLARIFRPKQALAPLEIDLDQALTIFAGPAPQGARLAGYTVERELACGEMAKVLKVKSRDGRPWAMKLPMPALVANHEFMQRFVREMRLGTRLAHPHIVRIEEVHAGGAKTGYPFILMEFVDGLPLDQTPRDDRLTLALGVQALQALEAIHAEGVVHRDLKPSNLMVTRTGQLKVMDFGVAHESRGPRLTAADQVLGTPVYMAPEQLLSSDPGPTADLYSLGLILYERLTGSLPFSGSVIEVITRKLNEDVPSLALVRPDLPAPVVDAVMGMLEREPARRYQTAGQARATLEVAIKGWR